MSTATKRVLPADVYDTLEFSALVYGGIGGGHYFDMERDEPVCAVGHIKAAEGLFKHEAEDAFRSVGLNGNDNDKAVAAINRRRKTRSRARYRRVPFRLWARELGIERGA